MKIIYVLVYSTKYIFGGRLKPFLREYSHLVVTVNCIIMKNVNCNVVRVPQTSGLVGEGFDLLKLWTKLY